jgi:ABC-2 type transport system permease protein
LIKLLATIYKDALILCRDRAGLAVLYVMPTVLVLVVSLVQDGALRAAGGSSIRMLFVDNDKGVLGSSIKHALTEFADFDLAEKINGYTPSKSDYARAVEKGEFQVCVLIPEDATELILIKAKQLALDSVLSRETATGKDDDGNPAEIVVYIDPAMRGAFRNSVISSIGCLTARIETGIICRTLSQITGMIADIGAENAVDVLRRSDVTAFPADGFPVEETPLFVRVTEMPFSQDIKGITPSSVQQNVPAWTMFAMFFIAIPLSSNLIRERDNGTMLRLMTMPISRITIFAGKIIVYVFVCMSQFLLIFAVGSLILPLLGTPELQTGASPQAIIFVALCSAMAASGFGLLVGTLFSTHQQASTFGAISIVIAAAIGGIMVPAFAMPEMMQAIRFVSPLGWGLDAFHDIFLRGGSLETVAPDALRLLAFACGCVSIAALRFRSLNR